MDEQVELLTSIRDILTRIERVLERIEEGGAAPTGDALASPGDVSAPPLGEAPASVKPSTFGRAKWTKR